MEDDYLLKREEMVYRALDDGTISYNTAQAVMKFAREYVEDHIAHATDYTPKKVEPPFFEIIEPTGSREICSEHREDSDIDFMCYTTEQDEAKITKYCETQGFKFSKSWMNGSSLSYKDKSTPQQNLIVIRDRLTFERWRCANRVCKYLDVKDKNERREIFHRIVYNEPLPDSMKVGMYPYEDWEMGSDGMMHKITKWRQAGS